MSSWHSYPKVYALGHSAIKDLLLDSVILEEKIDGCLSGETPVTLSDGTKIKIKNIYKSP